MPNPPLSSRSGSIEQRQPHAIVAREGAHMGAVCRCGWKGNVIAYERHLPKRTPPGRWFNVEFPSVRLRVQDVWPDGDWPEDATAEDVAAVMREEGMFRILNDWNLLPNGLTVDGVEVR